MLFRTQHSGVIAISQLAHAWISGQLLRAWDENFSEPLLLAAEQHDLGWIDWEAAPSFDASTGRPHLFRDVGATTHAPMWTRGVDLAAAAWGAHVALLISRHGGLIYRRYFLRHQSAPADAEAVKEYLETQAVRQESWARCLGFDEAQMSKESALVAFVDALSLGLCGELRAPLELEAPGRDGAMLKLSLTEKPGRPFDFVLSPWPFRESALVLEGEARPLPAAGRFEDEVSMRRWFAGPERTTFMARLASA
jgi:Protein of unknown function (DUF3891)